MRARRSSAQTQMPPMPPTATATWAMATGVCVQFRRRIPAEDAATPTSLTLTTVTTTRVDVTCQRHPALAGVPTAIFEASSRHGRVRGCTHAHDQTSLRDGDTYGLHRWPKPRPSWLWSS